MRSLFLAPAVFAASVFLVGCGGDAPPVPKYPPPVTGRATGTVLYRLPVVGKWRVHRTHYGSNNDQAYALDLVIDAPHPPSQNNANFPSYNQPIVADAPGVVVIAADGIPDNVPGVVNRYDLHGNYVVIDHQNGEFSLFAHFIPGSLKVRPGVFVAAGTELGRCGNSGQSTMPHLHWQVMSSMHASGARGIAPRYSAYERNGASSADLPQNGDRLVAP
jgi:murein DD-endopeptidase MepM/ murein hydrolase activator NlpD